MPKNRLKRKIKEKLKNEKSLKNLSIRSLHSPRDDHVAYRLVEGTHSTSQPYSYRWGWTHCQKSCWNFSWT